MFISQQLIEIDIKYTDEANEKTKEECCPGAPFVNFSTIPGVLVNISNPQIFKGFFSMSLMVYSSDTIANLISRISKENKRIKGE